MSCTGFACSSASKVINSPKVTVSRRSVNRRSVPNEVSAKRQKKQPRDQFSIFCDEDSEQQSQQGSGNINIQYEGGSITVPALRGTVGILRQRSSNIMGRAIDHNRYSGQLPVVTNQPDESVFHLLHVDPDVYDAVEDRTVEQNQRSARYLLVEHALDQLHWPSIYEDRLILREIVGLLDMRRQELLEHGISVDEKWDIFYQPETSWDIEDVALAAICTFDYLFLLRAIEATDALAQSIWFSNDEEEVTNSENIPPVDLWCR
ncbi:hypothetical protein CORC01_12617 [Colletotrichum orchidophilum]|uniref:Uncharacterized protein n=1 Tax=Colletotrichum orchidophilum TaxID=1209926 RepID=A0A1G4AST1_9PEZI|nr:uncharacterized protein CORC01_12617 [Colletotrichum orchidophilum]OHE92102.1 hypothetical protein CORC01_12617 [Colletotrichum orchidophilum]